MSAPTIVQLGATIRSVREARGLSIEALAEAADIHWTYLSEIERNGGNPTWTVLGALAKGLGLEISELAKRVEDSVGESD